MNRIHTLESDLRRSTTRLGNRQRPGKPRRPADAAPAAPPASTAAPAAVPPAVSTAPPASTQASVAAAMSAWQGGSSRRTARGMSVARPRARAFAVQLNYRVPDLPTSLRQATSMVCWAYVATMMASWRDRQSFTPQTYIGGLGGPWAGKLAANQGLQASEAPVLLATMGLQIETTQANFTAERWEQMLRSWGPIWVTADNNSSPEIQGVHAHILVGIQGPSDGDPTFTYIDPAVGEERSLPMSQFVARYEQLANTRFAGLQIRHWPANAQQSSQLSMAWAHQAISRARAMQVPASGQSLDWTTVSGDDRMRYVMRRLVDQYGYPVNGAAGIVGNLWAESGALPPRIEGSRADTPLRARDFSDTVCDFTPDQVMGRSPASRVGPKLPGVGLAQWTSTARRAGLFTHTYQGVQSGAQVLFDMDAQIDYLDTELRGSYSRVHGVVTNPTVTVHDASDEVVYSFEVPGSVLDGAGGKLPRSAPGVQAVFRERRAFADRALRLHTS